MGFSKWTFLVHRSLRLAKASGKSGVRTHEGTKPQDFSKGCYFTVLSDSTLKLLT